MSGKSRVNQSKPFEQIVVADDHPIFREALGELLTDLGIGRNIVQAGSFGELMERVRPECQPHLFVLDLRFPEMDHARSISILRGRFPSSSIVIVSMMDDPGTVEQVMSAGADGFVSKSIPTDRMREAFSAISSGEFVVLGAMEGRGMPNVAATAWLPPTQRQKDVLAYVCAGKSNKEIARALEISPFTVRAHVSALLRIFGADSRAHLAAIASSALREPLGAS